MSGGKTKGKPLLGNWCRKCKQEIDVNDEGFDGQQLHCYGCGRDFVWTAFTDGTFKALVSR